MTVALAASALVATTGVDSSFALTLQVRETAGIRRYNIPASATVELQAGAVADVSALRLSVGGQPVPVQGTVRSRWPDGSIHALELDFNVFIAPLERLRCWLTTAEGEAPGLPGGESLALTQVDDGWQAGKVRLGRRSDDLIRSAAFGRENIGATPSAFSVTDADGNSYLLSAEPVAVEKSGPLRVRLAWSGQVPFAGGPPAPFTVTAEIPNSKSWIRVEAVVEDPRRRVRGLAFATSFVLPAVPATWDLGTGSWSYGVFRERTDAAELAQTVRANGKADWLIRTLHRGRETIVERAGGGRPAIAEGWGHVQDRERVLAFAVKDFGREAGDHRIAFSADGSVSFHLAPLRGQETQRLVVYLHFVSNPTAIGAATPPVAMATPLEVTRVD